MRLVLHLPKVVLHLLTVAEPARYEPELAQEKLGQGFASEDGVPPTAGQGSELRLFLWARARGRSDPLPENILLQGL